MTKYYERGKPTNKNFVLKYDSNNSGGTWWLKDEDWFNLEKAGWKIYWIKDDAEEEGDRWLGALAKNADKEFDSVKDGLIEFEKITGQSVTDTGCNCCGTPHDFSWIDKEGKEEYGYGSSLLEFMIENKGEKGKDEIIARLLRNN